MGKAVCCDVSHAPVLGRSFARGSRGCLSRKGDRVSQGHGGSRTLWRTLPEVWRKDPADSLRGQRNELLRPVPDRRKSPRRSEFVSALALRLAAYSGRTRSSQASLKAGNPAGINPGWLANRHPSGNSSLSPEALLLLRVLSGQQALRHPDCPLAHGIHPSPAHLCRAGPVRCPTTALLTDHPSPH